VIRAALAAWLAVVVLGCGDSGSSGQSAPAPAAEPSRAMEDRPTAASAARPNLVLITLDTTRADALGAYGQPLPTSPRIDRMATEGVLFEQAITSSPETLPSHATLFTGRQPYAHGVRDNTGYALSDENRTLAEILAEAGYRTAAEIAGIVMRDETRIAQGFAERRDPTSPGVRLKEVKLSDRTGTRTTTLPMRICRDISDLCF